MLGNACERLKLIPKARGSLEFELRDRLVELRADGGGDLLGLALQELTQPIDHGAVLFA